MAQVAANGGDIARVALPTPTMTPLSVSPDGSTLLVADEVGQTAFHGPLWSVPVLGGSARKLGDIDTPSAEFSPDGQTIAYVSGNDLFLAKSDGSQSRKLVSLSDAVFDPIWSPDAKSIRFRLGGGFNSVGSLWEVGADGTNPHALLPGWHNTASECCGQWTPDANYFVFQSGSNVWSRAEKKSWFGKTISQPVQLTSGPLGYFSPLLSKDGKKLFVVGALQHGELSRYDVKSGQFSPFLSGLSADSVRFSRDGQWVAYSTFPGRLSGGVSQTGASRFNSASRLWRHCCQVGLLTASGSCSSDFRPGRARSCIWSPPTAELPANSSLTTPN